MISFGFCSCLMFTLRGQRPGDRAGDRGFRNGRWEIWGMSEIQIWGAGVGDVAAAGRGRAGWQRGPCRHDVLTSAPRVAGVWGPDDGAWMAGLRGRRSIMEFVRHQRQQLCGHGLGYLGNHADTERAETQQQTRVDLISSARWMKSIPNDTGQLDNPLS